MITAKRWKRMNPEIILRVQQVQLKKIFNGDHALQNEFVARRNITIEQVFEMTNGFKKHEAEKVKHQKEMESFRLKAKAGEITINLQEISQKFFYSSEEEQTFLETCFQMHQQQNGHLTSEENKQI